MYEYTVYKKKSTCHRKLKIFNLIFIVGPTGEQKDPSSSYRYACCPYRVLSFRFRNLSKIQPNLT